MIYKWLFALSPSVPFFNLFQYITFRSFLSFFTGFFVCWFLGYFFISRTRQNGMVEKISADGPHSHQKKKGVPTMGGIFILLALLTVCFLWVDLSEPLVLSALLVVAGFASVGLWDDLLKLKTGNFRGLPARWRLILEFVLCLVVLLILMIRGDLSSILYVPVFKDVSWDLGGFYAVFGALVITGCANAVNLTDGLDGLAVFPVLVCAGALSVFAYLAGHREIAEYLNMPFISGSGELVPLISAVVAGGLGFLWYNSHPAQVFMGDIGALGLGSFLGVIAVVTKNEILLVVLGGIFVAEALSVIFQVASYKLTGRRIFKMAPLHHHFELKGLEESKIIVRFWIVAILLAVLSFTVLKVR